MRCAGAMGIVSIGLCVSLLSGCASAGLFEKLGFGNSKTPQAKLLTAETISDLSSSGPMTLHEARIITDEEAAFQSKLELIRTADSEIRLVYHKFGDDWMGSVFAEELVTAARERNLNVKVLVDFWQNYNHLDFFAYMEKAGEGKIQVRFYGLSPIKESDGPQDEAAWFQRLYSSGFYGKNPSLMKVAKQMIEGYQKNPHTFASTALAESVLSTDFSQDVDNEQRLSMIYQSQGTGLTPLADRAPASTQNDVIESIQQRVLVVDGFRFQVGGYDLEHTDTETNVDFYGESAAALNIQAAFDRVFNFEPLVGDLTRVQTIAPNDTLMNLAPFQKSLALCLLAKKSTPVELKGCVETNLTHSADYETLENRLDSVSTELKAFAEDYRKSEKQAKAKAWKPEGDSIENTDLATIKAYYVENLAFTKRDPSKVVSVPKNSIATENGKYIHSLLSQSLENTCATAQASKKRKRVLLQSGSFLLPSSTLQTLGKMMNGEWKCQYVDIAIVTNSTEISSPKYADVFSRFQVQSLLQFQKLHSKNARLRFYEQNNAEGDEEFAAQSNFAVLGDDILLGSADASVRSYAVDTHGSIYLKNALQTARAYLDYVDRQIKDGAITDQTEYYESASKDDLVEESQTILQALLQKSPEPKGQIEELGEKLQTSALAFLEFKPPKKDSLSFLRSPASDPTETAMDPAYEHNKLWKNF